MRLSTFEIKVLSDLLADYESRLETDGCNDYRFPKTMKPAEVEAFKEQAIASAPSDEERDHLDDELDRPIVNNLVVLSHFTNRLKKALELE